jgi:hypothetical protein
MPAITTPSPDHRRTAAPPPRSPGRVRPPRPGTTVAALSSVVLVLASACASGSTTSFTSLDAADRQATAWLDAAVGATFPAELERTQHSAGHQSCTTAANFAEIDHETVVTVPAADVDRYTAAAYASLTKFFAAPDVTPATAPQPPGPGSPSWSLGLFHDGFNVEIVGSRTTPPEPYVRIRIITPCIATS